MIYRKRGSRKKADRIKAFMWLGHSRLFMGHGNRACLPPFAPTLTIQIFDAENKYDQTLIDQLEEKPGIGEGFKFGPHLLVGTEDGPKVMRESDYLAELPDGSLAIITAGQMRAAYTRMT